MPALLITLIGFISVDLIKKLLIGAGIGLATAAFFNLLLQYVIEKLITNLGGIPADILKILGLFGLDKALSIIIGALFLRATIEAGKLSFKKV